MTFPSPDDKRSRKTFEKRAQTAERKRAEVLREIKNPHQLKDFILSESSFYFRRKLPIKFKLVIPTVNFAKLYGLSEVETELSSLDCDVIRKNVTLATLKLLKNEVDGFPSVSSDFGNGKRHLVFEVRITLPRHR